MAVIAPPTSPTRPVLSALSRLAERLATPLLPADYLDVFDPLLSGTRLRGRIVAIHPETRDAVTLVIRPGAGWRRHTPGQYLRLGVEVDGVRQWRSYSITSRLDRPDRCVAVTVKAIPGGVVSNYLVRRATVGTIVHLGLAAGDFILGGRAAPAKLMFLTAGSGITPVMGILRNLAPERDCDIVVVHSAPSAADVIFGGELRMLAGSGWSKSTPTPTACSPSTTSTPSWATWSSATPGPADPPACSTPSRTSGPRQVSPVNCIPNGSVPASSHSGTVAP